MENTNLSLDAKPKRHRSDRLIGFRLEPAEYARLAAHLERSAIGISDYMRQLVRSDTHRVGHPVAEKR